VSFLLNLNQLLKQALLNKFALKSVENLYLYCLYKSLLWRHICNLTSHIQFNVTYAV